jgi:hypothetical protein
VVRQRNIFAYKRKPCFYAVDREPAEFFVTIDFAAQFCVFLRDGFKILKQPVYEAYTAFVYETVLRLCVVKAYIKTGAINGESVFIKFYAQETFAA